MYGFLLFFILLITLVLAVRTCRDPKPTLTILKGSVLACKIDAFGVAVACSAALRKRTCAIADLGGDGGIGRDPVGESVFAVLNGAVMKIRQLR